MKIYNQDKTQILDENYDFNTGLIYETGERDENDEPVCTFVPFTERELSERRIAELKFLLNSTDYQAIKYAEGELSEDEYAPTKAERAAWRAEINELEKNL